MNMPAHPRRRRERICPWCAQSFSKEDHLTRHVRRHTREKPFSCTACTKSFTRYDSLLRHARSHGVAPQSESQKTTPAGKNPIQLPGPSPGSTPTTPQMDSLATDQPHTGHGLGSPPVGSSSAMGMNASQTHCETLLLGDPATTSPSQHDPQLGTFSPWPVDWMSQPSTWLADDDFDLNAFNASVIASAMQSNVQPPGCPVEPPLLTPQSIGAPTSGAGPGRQEDMVRRRWYTFIESLGTGYDTPGGKPDGTQIDDADRENLAQRLQQRIPVTTEPLPSTEFLNMCIRMYFTRFNDIFPIIHQPTFRPSVKRSLLLLSICSMGSLFLGSSHATQQGIRIFETLNKAILSSWETYMTRGKSETLSMVQAALIGQTFGMLTGRPKDLLTVQTFHGTVITWAKRKSFFPGHRAIDQINLDDVERAPEQTWRAWAQAEEQVRLWAAVSIFDAELSELLLDDPLLRRSPSDMVSDDTIWMARTAQSWSHAVRSRAEQSRILTNPSASPIGFRTYIELAGLSSAISDSKSLENSADALAKFQPMLIAFHDRHIQPLKRSYPPQVDKFCLQALWHANFISLLADLDRLEQALGREGYEEAQRHTGYARGWANSPDGMRCAIHAVLLLHLLEALPVGIEPAIHVPRVLFRAIVVWFCYLKFGNRDETYEQRAIDPTGFPELKHLGVNCAKLLFEAQDFQQKKPIPSECSTTCRYVDLLGRIGHWGLSRQLGAIGAVLLHGDLETTPIQTVSVH